MRISQTDGNKQIKATKQNKPADGSVDNGNNRQLRFCCDGGNRKRWSHVTEI